MLHTKYQGSMLSGFRQEDILYCHYISLCKKCGYVLRPFLTTEPEFETSW